MDLYDADRATIVVPPHQGPGAVVDLVYVVDEAVRVGQVLAVKDSEIRNLRGRGLLTDELITRISKEFEQTRLHHDATVRALTVAREQAEADSIENFRLAREHFDNSELRTEPLPWIMKNGDPTYQCLRPPHGTNT